MSRETSEKTASNQICTRNITGIYDLESHYLKGESSHQCEQSGDFYTPALELAAGMDERESIQAISKAIDIPKNIETSNVWTGF